MGRTENPKISSTVTPKYSAKEISEIIRKATMLSGGRSGATPRRQGRALIGATDINFLVLEFISKSGGLRERLLYLLSQARNDVGRCRHGKRSDTSSFSVKN